MCSCAVTCDDPCASSSSSLAGIHTSDTCTAAGQAVNAVCKEHSGGNDDTCSGTCTPIDANEVCLCEITCAGTCTEHSNYNPALWQPALKASSTDCGVSLGMAKSTCSSLGGSASDCTSTCTSIYNSATTTCSCTFTCTGDADTCVSMSAGYNSGQEVVSSESCDLTRNAMDAVCQAGTGGGSCTVATCV